ncbi:MAG: hypothetical protein JJ863_23510 [Deltaproteobacteria bacterium]|nr:hypothetical protein [Deltaproteobacteria bacterium]
MARSLEEKLASAVDRCQRMDRRAGLLSEARYYPERMSPASREEAKDAERAQAEDLVALERFVAWALEHHRPALLAFGEELASLAVTDAFVDGWARTLERWRAGDPSVGAPARPPALFWLVALGERHRPATSAS